MRSGSSGDRFARVVGMLIFLLGVGLLVFVFYVAYGLFTTPPAQALGLRFTGDPKHDPQIAVIGAQFAWLVFRIAYLLIMSFTGSLVANKGVHLYFSSLSGPASPAFQFHPTVKSPNASPQAESAPPDSQAKPHPVTIA